MEQEPIGVDIDGTLVEFIDDKKAYLSAERIHAARWETNRKLVDRVNAWMEAGRRVYFITGRTDEVMDATLWQLAMAGIKFKANGKNALIMQDEFTTMAAMVAYKAEWIQMLGIKRYYGDTWADMQAAVRADADYVDCSGFAAYIKDLSR